MSSRFRLHDTAFARLKTLRMPLSVLENLLAAGVSRPQGAAWEVSLPQDISGVAAWGRFGHSRVLISGDGRVLDIQLQ